MASTEKKNKDREMASHLLRTGYPHGRRMTSGHCPICYRTGAVHVYGCPQTEGTTRYRRYIERQRERLLRGPA